MSVCASRMPDSAVRPTDRRRAVLPARSASHVRSRAAVARRLRRPRADECRTLEHGAPAPHRRNDSPGAAAIPRRTVATDYSPKSRSTRSESAAMASSACGPSARTMIVVPGSRRGQDAKHAFRIADGAIFHDLDLRVLEPRAVCTKRAAGRACRPTLFVIVSGRSVIASPRLLPCRSLRPRAHSVKGNSRPGVKRAARRSLWIRRLSPRKIEALRRRWRWPLARRRRPPAHRPSIDR